MNPQTKYHTIVSNVVVTIMTLATIISSRSGGTTCHSIGISEMNACSESDTYQDDNDHEDPASTQVKRNIPVDQWNINSSDNFRIRVNDCQRRETVQLH